jgi:hypothetical protein
MGFLLVFGRPLEYEESKQHFETIRKGAVEAIINWINETRSQVCCPKFGYEVSNKFSLFR